MRCDLGLGSHSTGQGYEVLLISCICMMTLHTQSQDLPSGRHPISSCSQGSRSTACLTTASKKQLSEGDGNQKGNHLLGILDSEGTGGSNYVFFLFFIFCPVINGIWFWLSLPRFIFLKVVIY